MSYLKQAPLPLFDTLAQMENPRIAKPIDTTSYFNNPPAYVAADYNHACEFLYSYRGSSATFNAYRREIERLLHWCWFVQNKSVKDLTRNEFESFVEFCQSPPEAWIGLKNVARFSRAADDERQPNPEWRPFVVTVTKTAHRNGESPSRKNYTLSQKALQAIFSIASSFYNFLIQEDYAALNPVSQIRQKSKFIRKQQGKPVIRRLSELQWAYVINTAEAAASKDPATHERTLFIMNALYGMYLRISELTATPRWQPTMGDFHKDNDGHWWFTTVGKGNKQRDIAVSDAMLSALKRYRLSLGLTSLPTPGETTPLIQKARGKGPITSTRHIRLIVQDCFDMAIDQLKRDNHVEEAEQMSAATVHWLRHTGISDDVKFRPREHVRDDAGHGSSAITDKYIDIELRQRHASGRHKLINPDGSEQEES
ncbi:MAG: integrase [Legionellales bacterium]|nr:integrase [Legionellales bacterium]|tara:strand:+ start:717 stop:1991 length:1275 start_codon:yes stop_codon:yes gene_type:complete